MFYFRLLFVIELLMVSALSFAQTSSLYRESTYQALASDRKAHRIGDLITVMVYENSSATSTANTSAGRDAEVGIDMAVNGKGYQGGVNGSVKSKNQLDGRGSTQREGRVLAQITVTVRGIAESGDLLIFGEQLLEVNNERQQIKVAGRIRPQDISDTNTILSTRIADAKISYVGEGDLADKQRPTWWHRMFSWFGL